jgi:hypothetical protein
VKELSKGRKPKYCRVGLYFFRFPPVVLTLTQCIIIFSLIFVNLDYLEEDEGTFA